MGVRKAPIRPSKLISCPHLHMLALHAMPSWCYGVTLACVYLCWQASPVKISSKCTTLGIIIDSCFHFPKRQLKMAWVSLNVPTSTSIQSSLYFKRKKHFKRNETTFATKCHILPGCYPEIWSQLWTDAHISTYINGDRRTRTWLCSLKPWPHIEFKRKAVTRNVLW